MQKSERRRDWRGGGREGDQGGGDGIREEKKRIGRREARKR